MGLPAEEIRITRTLSVDEVHWPQVLELLQKRQKLAFREASRSLDQFLSRFTRPLHIGWLIKSNLSREDNALLAAVCECHGADGIILTVSHPYRAGPLRLHYAQSVQFTPTLRASSGMPGQQADAIMQLRFLGRLHEIRTLPQAIFAYAMLGLLGVLSYVFLMGALLYALSVFLLFLEHPAGVTEEATGNPAVGLALLCFLVAGAAIFGRAISNLSKLLIQKLKTL